jgi:hypothetical protein
MITGVTLIRNGNELKYPWKECIWQLCQVCDHVLVNCGHSTDGTSEEMYQLAKRAPKISFDYMKWDMKNTGNGQELARQVNLLLPFIGEGWVLYLQADEFIHENDRDAIHKLVESLPNTTTQVELYRTYFWGWDKRAPKHEIFLGRLFRAGTHEVGGDGMYLVRKYGQVVRAQIPIYHYSRVGSEEDITRRVRTLDTLFHEADKIKTFPSFKYDEIPSNELIDFKGTHPKFIREMLEKTNG